MQLAAGGGATRRLRRSAGVIGRTALPQQESWPSRVAFIGTIRQAVFGWLRPSRHHPCS